MCRRVPCGAHGVGVVDDDLELAVHFRVTAEEFCVLGRDVEGGDLAGGSRCGPGIRLDKGFDIGDPGGSADRHGLRAAELESVPFAGIVRGSDHDPAVGAEKSVRMIVHGRGAEAEIDDVGALFGDAFCQGLEKRFRVRPHVASDDDFPCAGVDDEGAADLFGDSLVELFRVNAADVVGFEDSGHGPNSFLKLTVLETCIKAVKITPEEDFVKERRKK